MKVLYPIMHSYSMKFGVLMAGDYRDHRLHHRGCGVADFVHAGVSRHCYRVSTPADYEHTHSINEPCGELEGMS